MEHSAHATFELRYHLVLVTKYRRRVLNDAMLEHARQCFNELLPKGHCRLLEFGGESDHVHILFEATPAIDLSVLVANLKSISSRRLRTKFRAQVLQFYRKPVFWSRAYYIGSVGHASLATVQAYVEHQRGAA